MAEVIITQSAQNDIKDIYQYYDLYSHQAAEKLMEEIFNAARRLKQFPEMGPKEPAFEQLERNYRYVLVMHRYKLIYLFENEVCSILMVWDCKAAPFRGALPEDQTVSP